MDETGVKLFNINKQLTISKEQIQSRGTNWRLPFAVNVILYISLYYIHRKLRKWIKKETKQTRIANATKSFAQN